MDNQVHRPLFNNSAKITMVWVVKLVFHRCFIIVISKITQVQANPSSISKACLKPTSISRQPMLLATILICSSNRKDTSLSNSLSQLKMNLALTEQDFSRVIHQWVKVWTWKIT